MTDIPRDNGPWVLPGCRKTLELLHLRLFPCQNGSREIRSLKGPVENSDKLAIFSLAPAGRSPAPRDELHLVSLGDRRGDRDVPSEGSSSGL